MFNLKTTKALDPLILNMNTRFRSRARWLAIGSERLAARRGHRMGFCAPNWSAKVEYNYLGLDDRTFTVPAGSPFLAGDTFTQSNRNFQMVKVGINYLFNWSSYRY